MVSIYLKKLFDGLNQGRLPYLIILIHVAAGSLLVYTQPRSSISFLILISSFLSLYFSRQKESSS